MRSRMIKPEFWRSADIACLDLHTRLLFIGLWSYVDDNGVGRDEAALIAADLFAYDLSRDPLETLRSVTEGLSVLSETGLIVRFENGGRPLLQIVTWNDHQRISHPGKDRFPLYDAENSTILPHSGKSPEGLQQSSGLNQVIRESGNQVTREVEDSDESSTSPISDEPKRDDVERVCQHMAKSIQERGGKKPSISKAWRDSARLMLDKDQIAEKDIHAAIDWSANDSFWRSNILSVPKLREKYLQLSLQAQRQPSPSSRRLGLVQPTTDEQTQEIVNAIYTPPLLKEILAHEAQEQAEKEATA